jgi:hypothetical protein
MFLGLLVVAMAIGAASAGVWLYTGGSLLAALAIYALVATFLLLGCAVVAFLIADRRTDGVCRAGESLQAAE